MLTRPREWLGYPVELNDLLPDVDRLITRFEQSRIPLLDTFGSSSDPPVPPPPFTVFFGPGVEPARLLDVLALLRDAGVRFLHAGTDDGDRKRILIGSYNGDRAPVTPYSAELARRIGMPGLTPDELTQLVRDAAHLRVVRGT